MKCRLYIKSKDVLTRSEFVDLGLWAYIYWGRFPRLTRDPLPFPLARSSRLLEASTMARAWSRMFMSASPRSCSVMARDGCAVRKFRFEDASKMSRMAISFWSRSKLSRESVSVSSFLVCVLPKRLGMPKGVGTRWHGMVMFRFRSRA